MDDALPPLTQFILPGGGQAAACLHLARTVARRAERAAIALGRALLAQQQHQREGLKELKPEPLEQSSGSAASAATKGVATTRGTDEGGQLLTPLADVHDDASSTDGTSEPDGVRAGAGAASASPVGGVEKSSAAAEADAAPGTHEPGPEGSGGEVLDPAVRVYLNRLSDFLFTAARHMAAADGQREATYRKPHLP
jgi:hypothetical protein